MPTVIDRKSAEDALATLVGEDANGDVLIKGDALKNALVNVLARKLGQHAPALPTGDRSPDKFERFFDILFNVAFEDKPLAVERVIELAEDAVRVLRSNAKEERDRGVEDDLSSMYDADAEDYEAVVSLLKSGDIKAAVAAYRNMDTAARERLYGANEQEEFELSRFLNDHGY